jgi:acyl transferase domain-containing protein
LERLAVLAELYVQGIDLNFERLFAGDNYSRLSLPTYPFSREKYWIEKRGKGIKGATSVLHPLAQRNTSKLDEQRYSGTLSGEEFFLKDHVIQGRRVLPGVAYLEMARAAMADSVDEESRRGKRLELRSVVWSRPLVVEGSVEVHIGLYGEEGTGIEFEIYTIAGDRREEVVHAQGRGVWVLEEEREEQRGRERIDFAALSGKRVRGVSGESCYALFGEMGLEYGAGHRGLLGLELMKEESGEEYVIGEVSLPESVKETEEEYGLHPSVLDSALQAAIGFSMDDGGAKSGMRAALPFALEGVEVYGRSGSRSRVLVKRSAGYEQGKGSVEKYDLWICDEQGVVSVRLKGFSSRVLTGGWEKSTTLLLKKAWVSAEAGDQEQLGEQAQGVGEEETDEEIDEEVWLGREYAGEVQGLSERYPQKKWSVLAGSTVSESVEEVFSRVQGLLQGKPKQRVCVQVVKSAAAWQAGEQSALSGLLKSAHVEQPKIVGQVVSVSGVAAGELGRVVEENGRRDGQWEGEVRYVEGVR